MGLKNEYLKGVLAEVERRDAGEPEFIQAVTEVLGQLTLRTGSFPTIPS